MLFDLQSLYIVPSERQGDKEGNGQGSDSGLNLQTTTYSVPREDDGTGGGHEAQQKDEVTVDSVKENAAVTDSGHKLEASEERSGKDSG